MTQGGREPVRELEQFELSQGVSYREGHQMVQPGVHNAKKIVMEQ